MILDVSTQPFNTCKVLGVNVSLIKNMGELTEFISDNYKYLKGKYICFSCSSPLVKAYEDKSYQCVLNSAHIVAPDGISVAKSCNRRCKTKINRITGPDFMHEIFNMSIKNNYRHFFYGTTQDVLNKLKINLEEKYKGINIVGMFAPPFRQLTSQEDADVIKMINDSNADFVWIGLGSPKQDVFMYNHLDKINGLMFGVGAGFNFFAGTVKRAPKWVQKINMEWLYRFLQEPVRLFKRTFFDVPKFIWLSFILKK